MKSVLTLGSRPFYKTALFIIVSLAIASPTQAALVLQFGQGGTAGTTNFNADPGEILSIEVYITQTDGDTRLSDDGLGSFEFEFTIGGDGTVVHSPTQSYAFQDGLDNLASEARTNQLLHVGAFADSDPNNATRVVPVKAPTILLGIATVNVSELAAGDYPFAVSPASDISFTTGTNPLAAVDVVSGSATLTVSATAVPEPSSIAFLAMGFGAVAVRRRRSTSRARKVLIRTA